MSDQPQFPPEPDAVKQAAPVTGAGHDSSTPGLAEPAPGSVEPSRVTFLLATLAGLAFAVFPLIRPWGDKTGDLGEMAQAFADPLWVYAHLSGMIGWVLLVAAARIGRQISTGSTRTLAIGVAAVLPYYGAETFALHVLGRTALDRGDLSLVAVESLIRAEPVATVLFGAGLLAAAAGGALLALDTWKRGPVRWAGIPLAILVGLYLPQFFAPDAARIVHGVLLGMACALWGASFARR